MRPTMAARPGLRLPRRQRGGTGGPRSIVSASVGGRVCRRACHAGHSRRCARTRLASLQELTAGAPGACRRPRDGCLSKQEPRRQAPEQLIRARTKSHSLTRETAHNESSLFQMSRGLADFLLSFAPNKGGRGRLGRPSLGVGPGVAWPKSRSCGVRAGRAGDGAVPRLPSRAT